MRQSRAINPSVSPPNEALDWLGRIPNRLKSLSKDLQESRQQLAETTSTEERLDDLVSFYQQYEQLIETLCDAANYGPDPKLDSAYDRLRVWMLENYPRLRQFITAYLRYDVADCQQSMNFHGESGDAFESLFAAPTLKEFLRYDDGLMISRIMRTREALSQYGDHLKQLVGRR